MTFYIRVKAPQYPKPKFTDGVLYYDSTKAYPGETLEVPEGKEVYAAGYIKNEGGDGQVQIKAYDRKTGRYIASSQIYNVSTGTTVQGFVFKIGVSPSAGWDIELHAGHLEGTQFVVDDRLGCGEANLRPPGALEV